MEKIKYHKQEKKSADRPLRLSESGQASIITEPATKEQLMLLSSLGIYPKWQATRYEAQEMIDYHQLILNSVDRRRW
ncbi:MAG: hypothetical protein WC770_03995 [Phycisphaerae bacterium]|jgi:hypothetical protein